MKTFYVSGCNPSYWEILFDDILYYYIKPIDREWACIDRVLKADKKIFKTIEELESFLNNNFDREISILHKQIEFLNGRKWFLKYNIEWIKNRIKWKH